MNVLPEFIDLSIDNFRPLSTSQQNLKGNKALKLNISTLATVVYLLQIFTDYGVEYRRLIKE